MTGRRALYLTFDGVLTGLGFSQVGRVVLGLAARGIPYDLLSLERERDLADHARVSELESRLRAQGVAWTRTAYVEGRGARGVLRNMSTAASLLLRRARLGDVRMVHARGYHSALVGDVARTSLRIPYLFDARGYFIDERIEEGRWFTRPAAVMAARAVERRLYRDAAAVVTLTRVHAGDVAQSANRPGRGGPIVTIPTCADFDEFTLRDPTRAHEALPDAIAARIAGKLVVGLVGSLNRSYCVAATAALAREIVAVRADAHVLVVGTQHDAYRAMLGAARVPMERVTLTSATHDEMPRYMRAIDWCPMLLYPSRAKRASMPTRLAELLASGVRPLHYGCNDEVTEWVERAGTGAVLRAVDADEIRRVAGVVAASRFDRGALSRARELARAHFSLASGLDRYATLLAETFGVGP